MYYENEMHYPRCHEADKFLATALAVLKFNIIAVAK